MPLYQRLGRGAAWALGLLFLEALVVLGLSRRELTSVWEVQHGLVALLPILVATAVLLGTFGAWFFGLFLTRDRDRGDVLVTLTLGSFAAVVAYGVGGGRHLASTGARLGFALGVAFVAAGVAYAACPFLSRLAQSKPRLLAAFVALGLLGSELLNRWALVRLYPAFHLGLAGLALLLAPGLELALPLGAVTTKPQTKNKKILVYAFLVCGLLLGALAPVGARVLSNFDNFRLLLLERAPLLGQSVRLAARLAPPPPLTGPCEGEVTGDCSGLPAVEGKEGTFDWHGRDLLLITIDALRADHLGAYGYSRPTSPNIDALAKGGVRFASAYAPTAHTSYSVTSLMTGKYMRPLLLQGAGQDSETFATLLRRYGYRTAGFYPPAVFFIDPTRFESFSKSFLGFEYRKVEFLEGHPRVEQVRRYLTAQPASRRIFVWVHFFAPHEPYEAHPEHPFGDRDLDRYDSEIAATDAAVGELVALFRQRRPSSLVVLTADHGEEFGEHGGRYHGTSVYEEQVHVPLIFQAEGLLPAKVVTEPVQTIDILPTLLRALQVPRPPRVRGRDLGPVMLGTRPEGRGLAFAETEEQTLLAEERLRLVCARQLGACKLYDLSRDPTEHTDFSGELRDRHAELRRRERELSASHGTYETSGLRAEGRGWPTALIRGIAGDGDAAEDVAALLDDADREVRRKAAEVLFELHQKGTAPALRLALGRDEDREVRAYAALALTRLGEGAPLVNELLAGPDPTFARLAALALAESGDPRGTAGLIDWWKAPGERSFSRSREILVALGRIKAKEAVPVLLGSLEDVRLRPYLAAALGEIGEPAAKSGLLRALTGERYQGARIALTEALVRLGAHEELARPLARFLGVPDPLPGGLGFALRAGILQHLGGPAAPELRHLQFSAATGARFRVVVPPGPRDVPLRLLLRVTNAGNEAGELRFGRPRVTLDKPVKSTSATEGYFDAFEPGTELRIGVPAGAQGLELPTLLPAALGLRPRQRAELVLIASASVHVEALAIVPLAEELPPPPPIPWTPTDEGNLEPPSE